MKSKQRYFFNLLTFVFCISIICSCKKDDAIISDRQFSIIGYFEIPAGLNTFQTHSHTIPNLANRVEATINQDGKTINDISSITVREITWQSFSNTSFNFIRQANNYIDDFTDQNKPPLEIGYTLDFTESNGGNLNFIPGQANVRNYFTDDLTDFIVEYSLVSTPPTFVEVEMVLTFDIKYN